MFFVFFSRALPPKKVLATEVGKRKVLRTEVGAVLCTFFLPSFVLSFMPCTYFVRCKARLPLEKSRHGAQLFKIQEFKRCVTISYCYLQSFKSPALQERAKQVSSPEKTRHITFKRSFGLYFTHSFCGTIKLFRRK